MADGVYPTWWYSRGVIISDHVVTNDYAAANQGQFKWILTNAYAELEERLPGGAGQVLRGIVPFLSVTNNFMPINSGQVRSLAKLFYDRLIEEGYTDRYPWSQTVSDDLDFSAVNIGQIKNLFAFDLTVPGLDGDTDWLSDEWEQEQFGELMQRGNMDSDGDGLCNRAEQAAGTDPLCADSDSDGIPDGLDAQPKSNEDRDQDGLPDDWERFWFGDLRYGGENDPDSDGWSNLEEWCMSSNPTLADVSATEKELKLVIFRPAK